MTPETSKALAENLPAIITAVGGVLGVVGAMWMQIYLMLRKQNQTSEKNHTEMVKKVEAAAEIAATGTHKAMDDPR